ncbi:MAG: TrkA family potassium uptake protein [Actinobacteria bacterium]|nr:TrkA family potassium uptake protein [Actinomycetota bacterium]
MHVIVVGCGRVGSEVARGLAADGHHVVVIDRRAEAFRRLGDDFAGTTIVGVGFDRDLLSAAGITEQSAVAAVTSGDNSNILIARVAKETFGVSHVVARIYDPRRASIYERLGIATVATVAWTSERVLRHLLGSGAKSDWIDPSGKFTMVERTVPASTAGNSVASLESATSARVAIIHRFGETSIPAPTTLLQEDDQLHIVIGAGMIESLDSHLAEGPIK